MMEVVPILLDVKNKMMVTRQIVDHIIILIIHQQQYIHVIIQWVITTLLGWQQMSMELYQLMVCMIIQMIMIVVLSKGVWIKWQLILYHGQPQVVQVVFNRHMDVRFNLIQMEMRMIIIFQVVQGVTTIRLMLGLGTGLMILTEPQQMDLEYQIQPMNLVVFIQLQI